MSCGFCQFHGVGQGLLFAGRGEHPCFAGTFGDRSMTLSVWSNLNLRSKWGSSNLFFCRRILTEVFQGWEKLWRVGTDAKLISKGGFSFHFSKAHFNWRKYFLDAIASPSIYPCQWVIFSDFGGSYHIYRAWELVQKMQWSKDLFFWGQEKHRWPHKQGDGISAALSRESALFKRFQALSKKTDGSKKKQSNLSQWFFEQITIPVDKVAKICWIGNLGNLKIHLWC